MQMDRKKQKGKNCSTKKGLVPTNKTLVTGQDYIRSDRNREIC